MANATPQSLATQILALVQEIQVVNFNMHRAIVSVSPALGANKSARAMLTRSEALLERVENLLRDSRRADEEIADEQNRRESSSRAKAAAPAGRGRKPKGAAAVGDSE